MTTHETTMHFAKTADYYHNSRVDLVNMLPSVRGRILEIGCGCGSTLAYLKSRGAAYVAGIDICGDAIAAAEKLGLDFTLVADVEREKLPFREKEFDCIILADVLEHLYDPWNALKSIAFYLKDGGRLLISIPNISHYTILRPLIFSDQWTYADLGILDNSHIRFFTLKEIRKLVEGAGLRAVEVKGVVNASWKFRMLNRLLFNKLQAFSVVQYYVMAGK